MALKLPTRERLRELSKERPTPAMIQEIIRAIITRVMQDKILMGLVILGVLAVFVVPNVGNDEKPAGHGTDGAHGASAGTAPEAAQAVGQGHGAQPAASEAGAPGAAAAPNPNAVDPKLADQFVKFSGLHNNLFVVQFLRFFFEVYFSPGARASETYPHLYLTAMIFPCG